MKALPKELIEHYMDIGTEITPYGKRRWVYAWKVMNELHNTGTWTIGLFFRAYSFELDRR